MARRGNGRGKRAVATAYHAGCSPSGTVSPPRRTAYNAILPSWVDTPMLRGEVARQAAAIGADPQRLLAKARKAIPLRRLVEADEAASLVAFLAREEAGTITAQGYVVDGGHSCGV